jgi:hypothetical protein
MKSLTLSLWIVLVSLMAVGTFKTANGVAVAVQFDESLTPSDDTGKLNP